MMSKTINRQDSSSTAPPSGPESRYLSVLFCDLANSTTLTREIGPEKMFELISQFQTTCRRVMEEHGGYLARYMGDGFMAYFGYPDAIENSAVSALRAAEALIERLNSLHEDKNFPVRIGLDCGWNVVGELHQGLSGQEVTVIGDTPNIAARLQSAAKINEVLVTTRVSRQADGIFVFGNPRLVQLSEDLGSITARRLCSNTGNMTSSRAAAVNSSQRHLGHRQELRLLKDNLLSIQKRTATWLELRGQGGIGKTQLLKAFRAEVEGQDAEVIDLYCAPHQRNSILWPLLTWLTRHSAVKEDSLNVTVRNEQLASFLRSLAPDVVETEVVNLTALCSQSRTEDAPVIHGDSLIQIAVQLLRKIARSRGLILIVEDVHWADPSTRELLQLLQNDPVNLGLLAIASYRPDSLNTEHFWNSAALINLAPLDKTDAGHLLSLHDPEDILTEEQRTAILEKADGIPLFIQEITRATLESLWRDDNNGETQPLIPDTLAEALVTRVNRLPEARPTIEAAAVIGRGFSSSLISRILNRPIEEIELHIQQLMATGLLDYVRDTANHVRYQFSHALLRDAANQLMLDWQRRKLHEATLQAYLLLRPGIERHSPEDIAPHYLGAGRVFAGSKLLKTAADTCFLRGQFYESAAHLNTALSALKNEEDTRERTTLELELQTAKGKALIQKLGFAAPDVEAAFSRAWNLCARLKQLGEPEYQNIWGLWANRVVAGYDTMASDMFQRLQSITEETQLPLLKLQTASAATIEHFCQGRLPDIQTAAKEVDERYDLSQHRMNAVTFAQDPKLLAQLFAAHGSWISGQQADYTEQYDTALEHLEELALPFLFPYTLVFANCTHLYEGLVADDRPEDLTAHAEKAQAFAGFIARASEENQPFWALNSLAWQAVASARMGQWHDALSLFDASLPTMEIFGQKFYMPFFRAIEAFCRAGLKQFEPALQQVWSCQKILAKAPQDRALLPELYRLHAEVLFQAGEDHHAAALKLLKNAENYAQDHGMWAWWLKIQHSRYHMDASPQADALATFERHADPDHPVAVAFRAALRD